MLREDAQKSAAEWHFVPQISRGKRFNQRFPKIINAYREE